MLVILNKICAIVMFALAVFSLLIGLYGAALLALLSGFISTAFAVVYNQES